MSKNSSSMHEWNSYSDNGSSSACVEVVDATAPIGVSLIFVSIVSSMLFPAGLLLLLELNDRLAKTDLQRFYNRKDEKR